MEFFVPNLNVCGAQPHFVGWQAQNTIWGWIYFANGAQRIGRGEGPVHGPRRMVIPIDPTAIDTIVRPLGNQNNCIPMLEKLPTV